MRHDNNKEIERLGDIMKRMKVGAYAEPEPEMTEDENWANAREMIFVDRQLAQDALELVEGMRLEEIVNTYALPLWIRMQKARSAKSLVDFIEEIQNTPLNDAQA